MITASSAKSAALSAVGALLVLSSIGAAGIASAQETPTRVLVPTAQVDTTKPSDITGLTARATSATTIELSWNAPTEKVIVRYEILDPRSNTVVAAVDASSTRTALVERTPGSWYEFSVTGYDAAGNHYFSDVVVLRTPSTDVALLLPDSEAPRPVSTVVSSRSRVTATSVHLQWTRSVDNVGVVEYRVRDRISGAVLATTHGAVGIVGLRVLTVKGLAAGTAYDLEIQAVDAAGNISTSAKSVRVTTQAAS